VVVGVVVQFHIISCYTGCTDDVPLVAVSVFMQFLLLDSSSITVNF
jgi:hypothetical protein